MKERLIRKLADGREIDVGTNRGLRKVCGCPRRVWARCGHPWHMNFAFRGTSHRISLDKHLGRQIISKAEAMALADELRTAIRNGVYPPLPELPPAPELEAPPTVVTFRALAELWTAGHGCRLASASLDRYRLKTINAHVSSGGDGVCLGARDAEKVTLLEVEEFRDARKAAGLSVVAVNHDLRLIRKIFAWGIRRGLVTKTPFKIGSEPAIRLDREIPRNRRLAEAEEQRLLELAEPLLRDVITAMLETGCRPGEVRALQWCDVSLERRELLVKAEKTKTRTERLVPISSRLLGVLAMRRHGPDGQAMPPSAYVFGNQIGEPVKSFRPAWERARTAAKIDDLHLADLRHEAASRFDEAGVPISFVSKLLGHTNLTTTSRYLNVHRRGLHMAMQKFEESRRLANGLQTNPPAAAAADAHPIAASVSKDLTIQ